MNVTTTQPFIEFQTGINEATAELDKLVQTLSDNPTVTIELSSHTDCRGKDAYNLSLSEKRAQRAVEYLIKQGIAKDRLIAKGYGETKPVAPNNTREGRAQNRRVAIVVLN